jgi:DNA invertase Pin-like site-specific DNA recombinase
MGNAPMRVALYLRVSTTGQTVENQKIELEKVAKAKSWRITASYIDHGISGTKGRDKRPQFDAMLKDATRRKFDMIAAWSVDRLGRSLQDLVGFLDDIKSAGVELFLHQQALDTSTPSGRAMFQMIGVFAEFERAMIVERVNAGIARARQQGKRLGRPQTPLQVEKAILSDLREGKIGIIKLAKQHGVGVSVVQRLKREMLKVRTRNRLL